VVISLKHFLVINPHSFLAPGSFRKIHTDIENSFSSRSDDYKVYVSRYPRDAIAAVHRYISNCRKNEIVRVYAVGGDGILFDCLNGMVDFPNAELTGVPYGNANDFPRFFGENVYEHFRDFNNLADAPSRPVDIINWGSNYSLIETQIGFTGHSVILADRIFKHIPERLLRNNVGHAYTICAILALFNDDIMKQHYTIFADNEELSGNYCHIHISNGACMAGTMLPVPYAKPDDGFLHVIIANTTSKIDIMKSIGDYSKGHFEKHERFIYRQCKKFEIKSCSIMSIEVDGEGFHALELKLEIIPAGIKIFAPEGLGFADYSDKAYKRPVRKDG
jgi:diacylglycerol kinase family enzyme